MSINIFFFLCSSLIFFGILLVILSSPLLLLISFFCVATWGVFSWYLLLNDLIAYILYIVYVGGVLVLFIYLIIISSNYQISNSFPSWIAFLFLSLALSGCIYMFPVSSFSGSSNSIINIGNNPWNLSAIVLLASFLLYIFLYICTTIRLGGRALTVGN